ncbi:MAG: transketolase [Epulopiscium sp. Nuni2H_MBin003]|nr:MAG: transketolase [Epulopiscium sp. Nuni2H_MBin003]
MEVYKMIHPLPAGHVGGSLSVADLLAVLYGNQLKYDAKNPNWEERDWVVMSKGHCGPSLYAALALSGFFPMEQLATLNAPKTNLPSHCDRNKTVGIDMCTGSLGQGASTAAGVAMGFKMDGKDNLVHLILGDGEINEGQVWEMALFASTRKLDNLIVYIDYNKFQLDGRTDSDEVCNLGDIREKFEAFGFYAIQADGHDMDAMNKAIDDAKSQKGKPKAIILDTIKGKGFDKVENKVGSHSCGISKEDLDTMLAKLQAEIDQLEVQ